MRDRSRKLSGGGICLLLVGILCGTATDVAASAPLFPQTFRGALRRSEAVLFGQILDKFSVETDGGAHIWTRYSLDVREVLAGDVSSDNFQFWVYGGRVGDRGVVSGNAVHYEVGERIVLLYDEENWVGGTALGSVGVLRELQDAGVGRILVNEQGFAAAATESGVRFLRKVRERKGDSWVTVPAAPNELGSVSNATDVLDKIGVEAGTHAVNARRVVSESDTPPVFGRVHARK